MILEELNNLFIDFQFNKKQFHALREWNIPTKPKFDSDISVETLAQKFNQTPDEIKLIFDYIFNDDQFLDQLKTLYLQGKLLASEELASYRNKKTIILETYEQNYNVTIDHNNKVQKQKMLLTENSTKNLIDIVDKWDLLISELETASKNKTLTANQYYMLSVLDKHSSLVKHVNDVYVVNWEKLKTINHQHILQIIKALQNGNET